jgi:hypothetical protein
LKALTCRQRRAFWELEDQGAYAGQARALYGKLKARVHALFGERRVLPLNTNVTPAEPVRWEDLARGYEALARAVDAFDWYRQEADTLGPAAARELLESIGAVQQQFYRLLESQFKGAADDQQRGLYEALLAAAEEQQIFLDSLNPRRTEEELRELAEVLPKIRQRLREGVAKKELQQQAVGRVLDLTDRADFGALDTDPSDLRDAAVACLKAGVPASNRSLRDALLPWTVLIDEEPQLANLVKEIDRELERRDKRDHPEETGDEDAGAEALSPEIQAMLQELLPHTRGKRCFFIGGDTREEKRRQLQAVLELEELVWPAARPTASVYDFEPEIARCDIIALLIRFMRTGFKQAVDLCRVHNTRVVRVPRGLGLTRIITDFHQQLVPRSDSDTGGS